MNVAQTNVTEDKNQKTFTELFCLAEFIRGVDGELTFLSALHIFLSITAFLGNTLILVALHKETSLHPPSKLLFRNLAITDLCVGVIAQPLAVTYLTSVAKRKMGYLLLHKFGKGFLGLHFVWSVSINIDSNKCGSTSRLVAAAQIQTSRNFEKNMYNCNRFLDFIYCRYVNVIFEFS